MKKYCITVTNLKCQFPGSEHFYIESEDRIQDLRARIKDVLLIWFLHELSPYAGAEIEEMEFIQVTTKYLPSATNN